MFIGIDCSTQSFKLQVINENRDIQTEVILNYDEDLPQYKTVNGVIRHNDHGFDHISTPTLLFIEAFELSLSKLKEKFDLSKIKAISGSGQQHGSVWWKCGSENLLKSMNELDVNIKLLDHFNSSFSKQLSPIWMDASTATECREITECDYIGGAAQKLASITGSHAYERFTGPQIKHVFKHDPEIYENTERISLISSFLPSLLIGNYCPIDLSDGSGMNMLNINTLKWDTELLNVIAPGLEQKLGEPAKKDEEFRFISKYWCKKYGFSPECQIHIFSGDNPCSLIGLGLNKAGDIGISLGTSDVLFAVTKNPTPSGTEGSILLHPEDSQNYMMMLVYKNGATTRKFIKDSVHENDPKWTKFNESILSTPVGNEGKIGFYYKETEITPNIANCGIVKYNEKDQVLENSSVEPSDCRGIIESQVFSYKYHAKLLGLNEINSITVTGGGSVNKEILQIIADVFEKDVLTSNEPNTACTGAAIKAMNGYNKSSGFEKPVASAYNSEATKPNNENSLIYKKMFERYANLEKATANFLNSDNK